MWELTPRKWTPERRKEDRNLLRAKCPWQVTALLSVRFSILQSPFIIVHPSQIFALRQTFSSCAGTSTVVLESHCRWREAWRSLRKSKVPHGSLNKLTPFFAERDKNLFFLEKGMKIVHNYLISCKTPVEFSLHMGWRISLKIEHIFSEAFSDKWPDLRFLS